MGRNSKAIVSFFSIDHVRDKNAKKIIDIIRNSVGLSESKLI